MFRLKDARDAVLEAFEPLIEEDEELIEVIYVAVTRKRDSEREDTFHVTAGSCLEVPDVIRTKALESALEIL